MRRGRLALLAVAGGVLALGAFGLPVLWRSFVAVEVHRSVEPEADVELITRVNRLSGSYTLEIVDAEHGFRYHRRRIDGDYVVSLSTAMGKRIRSSVRRSDGQTLSSDVGPAEGPLCFFRIEQDGELIFELNFAGNPPLQRTP